MRRFLVLKRVAWVAIAAAVTALRHCPRYRGWIGIGGMSSSGLANPPSASSALPDRPFGLIVLDREVGYGFAQAKALRAGAGYRVCPRAHAARQHASRPTNLVPADGSANPWQRSLDFQRGPLALRVATSLPRGRSLPFGSLSARSCSRCS